MSSSELQGGVLPAPPSFFECAAAARLVPSLKAAILYSMHTVLDSGAQGSATSLWALRSFDELVLVSQIAMEWICLRQGSASFAEGVYGLRRVPLPGNKKIKVMPSLFWLAVFPYLRTKLERAYARQAGVPLTQIGTQYVEAVPRQLPPLAPWPPASRGTAARAVALWERAKRAVRHTFVATYPFCHAAVEGCELSYQAAFLVAGAPFFSPYLQQAGCVLARSTPRQTAAAAQAARRRRAAMLAGRGALARTAMQTGWVVADNAREALILFVLSFKALEWYFASGESRVAGGGGGGAASASGGAAPSDLIGSDVAGVAGLGVDFGKVLPSAPLPLPPAPPSATPHPRGCGVPADARLCPLCRRSISNPAAAVRSGYVYCYPCLVDHVRRERTCPVTCLPMGEEGVRRLYLE